MEKKPPKTYEDLQQEKVRQILTSLDNQYNRAHVTIQYLDDFFKYIYFQQEENPNQAHVIHPIKKSDVFDTESKYKSYYQDSTKYKKEIHMALDPFCYFAGLIEQKKATLFLPTIIKKLKENQLPEKMPGQLKENILSFQLLNVQLILDMPKEFICSKRGIAFLQKKQFGVHLLKFISIQSLTIKNIGSIEKINPEKTTKQMPHEIYNEVYHKVKKEELKPSDSLNEKSMETKIQYESLNKDIKKFVNENGIKGIPLSIQETTQALNEYKQELKEKILLCSVNTNKNED